MPFALNEATRYINPTKTLEYLAAGKPVVSTAIPDVVRNFRRRGARRRVPRGLHLCRARPAARRRGSGGRAWRAPTARPGMPRRRDARPSPRRGPRAPGARRSMSRVDVLVVGAGFSGAVVAERLADRGLSVLVIDKRPHIGGNAYDRSTTHGVLIHPYGPHIFHTNSERIVEYLSQFTAWRPYEHRVLAKVGEQLLPIPINIDTVNRLYGLSLDESSIQAFYDSVREPRAEIRTSEDVVLNAVGRDLYEKFFRGYTRKQWGLDPSELAAARDRAHSDAHQPRRPLLHRHVPVHAGRRLHAHVRAACSTTRTSASRLDVDFTRRAQPRAARGTSSTPARSMRIFDYRLRQAAVPLDPLRARARCRAPSCCSRSAVVNYPNDHDYTRITEFKHLTGQAHAGTSHRARVSVRRGRPVLPGAAARERSALQALRSDGAGRARRAPSSAAWRPTATTTWTSASARRWPPQAAAERVLERLHDAPRRSCAPSRGRAGPAAARRLHGALGRHRVHRQPGRRRVFQPAGAQRPSPARSTTSSASPALGIRALRYPAALGAHRAARPGRGGLVVARRAPARACASSA